MKSFDIISIGDATIDNFFLFHDATVKCMLNKEKCMIEIGYGTKIPVDKYVRTVAGNAANNAVGSARLGMKTAFYTVLGDDASGHEIRKTMIKEGVDPALIHLVKHAATNISAVLSFREERTIFVYHVERKYQLPKLPSTKWIYLTSVGPLGPPVIKLHKQIEQYLTYHPEIKLGFNPGTHQLKMGMKRLLPIFKRTHILFLNKEEAELLLEKKTGSPIKELLKGLFATGAKIVVITDGPQGSYVYDGANMYHTPIFRAPIVERTGCGDSYGTAFLAAVHYKKTIPEAMRWGSINAAGVLQEIGPQKGLLTKKQVEERAKKHKEFKAKIIPTPSGLSNVPSHSLGK